MSQENGDMLVCHIAPGQWAGHMRIFHRECKSIALAGYKVDLLAHTLEGEMLENSSIGVWPLGVYNIKGLKWNIMGRIRRCIVAYKHACNSNARLFHYHSPEFITWGAIIRKRIGRPIIFDCMEDFEGYVWQRRGIPQFLRPYLAYFVKQLLILAAKSCDAVIVADQGTYEKFKPYAKRLILLHNFPLLSLFQFSIEANCNQQYDLIYHGSIPRYHLETCLKIDEALMAIGWCVTWRLIGKMAEKAWFQKELVDRGIVDRFFISDLIPHDRIAEEVRRSKIGIIPLPNLPKFNNNIPQKLFEFMALGMPVVLSDLPPSRPFVGDGKSAVMVPPNDIKAYAHAIVMLLKDPELRRRMGAHGRRLIEEEYNWEKESQKLIDLYNDLLGGENLL